MLKESAQFKSLSENVTFNHTAKQMEIPELKQHYGAFASCLWNPPLLEQADMKTKREPKFKVAYLYRPMRNF